MERMESYGDQVQFEFPGHGKHPVYQVIGRGDRKMGFDGKHLLQRLNECGNVSDDLSSVFSLDAVRAAAAGKRSPRAGAASRNTANGTAPRQVRRAASAAPPDDTVEHDKYAYYREHRDELPDDIVRHAAEITTLMRGGKTAEAAFQHIVEQYY